MQNQDTSGPVVHVVNVAPMHQRDHCSLEIAQLGVVQFSLLLKDLYLTLSVGDLADHIPPLVRELSICDSAQLGAKDLAIPVGP